MKKILAIVLAVAMIASVAVLAGCGKSGDTKATEAASKTEDKATADQATADQKTGGTLTMATNAYFAPYEYYEGEDIVGIDVDVAKAIADKLGMELKVVDIEFDSIITGVQTGKYDMGMAGMTVNEERKQSVDFSDSYATGIQSVIVKEDSPITSVDDILAEGATYKVGVQLSTTGDLYITEDLGDAAAERVTEFQTGNDAVAALASGKIDAVVIDNEPAKSYVAATAGLKILDTKYIQEDYAICFAKDNTELKDKVNGALKELIADGTVQSIIDKYITAK
ncbi:transporter substrate-binding domain-containing protein [uncultured Ruminococcus sp.]|uniref:transporter substrate-binding domain-containing protein n=1 Tax=uncultured Ruminococcus sp. TaxID=165186 RepID=UPI002930566C|nr:transporter substrate-binding domain-containing protein [uncultured Ruminococcus sp.]